MSYEAKLKLFMDNQGIIKVLANRYYGLCNSRTGYTMEDIHQIAQLYVWQHLDRYDESKGRITTFITWLIKSAMSKAKYNLMFGAKFAVAERLKKEGKEYSQDVLYYDGKLDEECTSFIENMKDDFDMNKVIDSMNNSEIIREIFSTQSDKNIKILKLQFFCHKTQREISKEVGMSQSRVSFVVNTFKKKCIERKEEFVF